MDQNNVKNIFLKIKEKYGNERSFGEAEVIFLDVISLLNGVSEMRDQKILPKISSEESEILIESSSRIKGLFNEIRNYDGRDAGAKDAIISAIKDVGNKAIPLCRSLLSSPNTSQAIIGMNERVENIRKAIENSDKNLESLSGHVSSFQVSVDKLKSRMLVEAANILGKSFLDTSNSAKKFKWFWFTLIIFGAAFFYCESTSLAAKINSFIDAGKTSYEIILMLVIERFALIFLPAILIYFSMKQFNAVSHIETQNKHKGNIGDVFAKIFEGSQGNEILNTKVSELLVKLAEEYPDGYIDGGGMKVKKITTPWGGFDVGS